jgi:hypothetical protein
MQLRMALLSPHTHIKQARKRAHSLTILAMQHFRQEPTTFAHMQVRVPKDSPLLVVQHWDLTMGAKESEFNYLYALRQNPNDLASLFTKKMCYATKISIQDTDEQVKLCAFRAVAE